jgi:S-adenosylmethionine:tRNA ribosyltransferase-isomerase
MSAIAFPEVRPACVPPELRGRGRDDVALLVARRSNCALELARFRELGRFVRAGDLLVVNDSATIPAALGGHLDGGEDVVVHLSMPLAAGRWVVEVRGADLGPAEPPEAGAQIALAAAGWLRVAAPYRGSTRLLEAELVMPGDVDAYLSRYGAPIRYGHCRERWPLAAYQTVFARAPGSAEMASAGRPFSAELVASLASRGVLFAPVTLHAGVSSLERDEEPYPERFRVPAGTARLVNAVHGWGGRVVAVGTTVVRALETAARPDGIVEPAAGWTELVVTPERRVRCVDGLITGWHEPRSSHLWMLEAVAGTALLQRSYAEAQALRLLGHEFGDAELIVP